MADFVESATLKIIDQSSKKIDTINAALKRLRKEATATQKALNKSSTPKINTSGIDTGIKKIRQLDAAAKKLQRTGKNAIVIRPRVDTTGVNRLIDRINVLRRRSTGLPTIAPQTGRGGGNNGMGGGRGRGSGGNGGIPIQIGPFQAAMAGFMARLGATIESSIIAGFKQGTSAVDLLNVRQTLLGITPAQRTAVDTQSRALAKQNPAFNATQIAGVAFEAFPSFKDVDQLSKVMPQLIDYANLQIASGKTSEEAINGLAQTVKAMTASGRLLDSNGNLDEKAVKDFMTVIKQETISGGKEITPEVIRDAFKSARTAGLSLNQEGIRSLLYFTEDMGSSAGVGINQLIKQLSGERVTKKTLANQMALGLTGSKEVETGKVGGKKSTELVSTGTVQEALLRTDPQKWVNDILIPKWIANGVNLNDPNAVIEAAGKATGQGSEGISIDPNNVVSVSKLAGQVTSDRTATQMLVQMITNRAEFANRQRIGQSYDVSPEGIRKAIADSSVASFNGAVSNTVDAIGRVGDSFKTVLIPVLNTVSSATQGIANFISGPTGESSMGRGAAVAGGVGLGLYGGARGLQALLGATGLNTAAINLTGAAGALLRAAVTLGGSGVAGAAGGIGGTGPRGSKIGAAGRGFAAVTGAAFAIEAGNSLEEWLRSKSTWYKSLSEKFDKENPMNLVKPSEPKTQDQVTKERASGELNDRISTLLDEIKTQRVLQGDAAANASPEVAGMQGELVGLTTLAGQMGIELETGKTNMLQAFGDGAAQVQTAIAQAASGFGTTASQEFMATAAAFGSQVAASMNAGFRPAPLTVANSPAAPDVGQNINGVK